MLLKCKVSTQGRILSAGPGVAAERHRQTEERIVGKTGHLLLREQRKGDEADPPTDIDSILIGTAPNIQRTTNTQRMRREEGVKTAENLPRTVDLRKVGVLRHRANEASGNRILGTQTHLRFVRSVALSQTWTVELVAIIILSL